MTKSDIEAKERRKTKVEFYSLLSGIIVIALWMIQAYACTPRPIINDAPVSNLAH